MVSFFVVASIFQERLYFSHFLVFRLVIPLKSASNSDHVPTGTILPLPFLSLSLSLSLNNISMSCAHADFAKYSC